MCVGLMCHICVYVHTHYICTHTIYTHTLHTHTYTIWRREKSRERERESARSAFFIGPGRPSQGGSAEAVRDLEGWEGGGGGGRWHRGLRSSIVVLDATNFMSVYTMALPNRNLNLHYLT
jgi:hypothetical protein